MTAVWIRNGRRLRIAVSVAAILACGAAVAWSLALSFRAHGDEEGTRALQRHVLEQWLLGQAYVLHGEDRPRVQWHEHTARIEELVASVRARVTSHEERETAARVEELMRRSARIFAAIEETTPPAGAVVALAARRRAIEDLALVAVQQVEAVGRLAEAAQQREESSERDALVLLAAVVLGAVVAVVLASRLVHAALARRIARLEEGADRIASGDLAHRVGMVGDDDLASLARSFDRMAERVAAGMHQLEESNRELEAFSYSVSHDLRAPLRHVTGFVDLLAERARPALDEKSLHYLSVISGSAQHLARLIDDLLAFSRTGRAALSPRVVEIRPIVDEVIATLARSEAHAPELVWDVAPLPSARVDPDMCRLVWTNLVANALKFSRTRPVARIEIGAAAGEDGELRFFVKDNGVGFDARYGDKLFGVFQRLHREEEFEGTGVGLASVQRIVHRHGGRVGAEGRVGGGATFWFSLPAGREGRA